MNDNREKALELGEIKSIREQAEIWVYYDTSSEDDHYVSPKELDKDEYKLVEKFSHSSEEEDDSDRIVEVEDYDGIKEGDQVIVDEENSEQVIRTSERQIITLKDKYRKSDGIQWGEDAKSGKKITHKVEL